MLLAVAGYAWLVATPVDLGQIRGDGFATLFYVANWHSIISGQSYFQASLAPSPLEHTWSLAIEEQFYLLWPLVVFGLVKLRNRPHTIFRASLALAAASVSAMVVLHRFTSVSTNSLYLGTHTRIAAIAMGAALAAWTVQRRHQPFAAHRGIREGAGWVRVLFLAWMWSTTSVEDGFLYRGGLALAGLAVVAVIAAATDPRPILLARAEYRQRFTTRIESIAADLTSTGAPLVIVTNVGNTDEPFLATMPDDLSERIRCTNDTYRAVADSDPGVLTVAGRRRSTCRPPTCTPRAAPVRRHRCPR